eukprot:5318321-Amphidinium_carterae.1
MQTTLTLSQLLDGLHLSSFMGRNGYKVQQSSLLSAQSCMRPRTTLADVQAEMSCALSNGKLTSGVPKGNQIARHVACATASHAMLRRRCRFQTQW